MGSENLRKRAFEFALRVIRLVQALPKNELGKVLGKQILRSSTSIGANLEESYAGLTRKDFTHSMNIAKKEALETKYWLKLIVGSGLVKSEMVSSLLQENDELIRILVSTVKTLQQKKSNNS